MNYMDAYTPYSLFTIAVITACVVYSAFSCAYGAVKVRKGLQFWAALGVQLGLVFWLAAKLLWLVSPSLAHRGTYLSLQMNACLLLIPPLFLFPLGMRQNGVNGGLLSAYGVVLFTLLACIAYSLSHNTGVLWDLAPILCFVVWNTFLVYNRRGLFAELSHVSIDVFMRDLEDMVVIFDPNGRLMDSNRSAKNLFGLRSGTITLEDFLGEVNKMRVAGERIPIGRTFEQAEIGLAPPGGERYYRLSATPVKNMRNAQLATVLVFQDITEKTMLQKEMERKNAELRRLNEQFRDYLKTAEELEEERERALAAKKIRETIGERIQCLLNELEALNAPEAEERLPAIIQDCRDVMASIRSAVKNLMPAGERDVGND